MATARARTKKARASKARPSKVKAAPKKRSAAKLKKKAQPIGTVGGKAPGGRKPAKSARGKSAKKSGKARKAAGRTHAKAGKAVRKLAKPSEGRRASARPRRERSKISSEKRATGKKTAAPNVHRKASAQSSAARPALRFGAAAVVRNTARLRRASPPSRGAGRRSGAALDRARGRLSPARGVAIAGPDGPRHEEILTPGALAFLGSLHRRFEGRRRRILAERPAQQARYDAREPADIESTGTVREDNRNAQGLCDSGGEIKEFADRALAINVLNTKVSVSLADFEDARKTTWASKIECQLTLKDRWSAMLHSTEAATGREDRLGESASVLIVRPRDWHLTEQHLTVDGAPISGALLDFGLYVFHNVRNILGSGTFPYFYLPKLETPREARLWNDVFVYAQARCGLPSGTIKAAIFIERRTADFEMDQSLWELREHLVLLEASRWECVF